MSIEIELVRIKMDYLLSIVIPAYNEEGSIENVLKEISTHCAEINYEVIVINDGSSDNTSEIVKQFSDVVLIEHEKNMGKGAALQTGFNNINGNLVLIQDADMEYHPRDIPSLLEPILSDNKDVVYGSRFKGDGTGTMSFSHKYGNWILSFATRVIFGFKTTDMETGYKLFKKDLITGINFKAQSFNIEPELTAIFSKKKAKFAEVPISYKYRVKDNAKISWKDGVIGLWWLIKLRFKKFD